MFRLTITYPAQENAVCAKQTTNKKTLRNILHICISKSICFLMFFAMLFLIFEFKIFCIRYRSNLPFLCFQSIQIFLVFSITLVSFCTEITQGGCDELRVEEAIKASVSPTFEVKKKIHQLGDFEEVEDAYNRFRTIFKLSDSSFFFQSTVLGEIDKLGHEP